MTNRWRYIRACVPGTSHVQADVPCEDALRCSVLDLGEEVLVAAVADGAGSARLGGKGAELLTSFIHDKVLTLLHGGGAIADITKEQGLSWIDQYRLHLEREHCSKDDAISDYACTLLLSVVGKEGAAFLHVGDGCIVILERDDSEKHEPVFWPNTGCYSNVTFFVTDEDVEQQMKHCLVAGAIDEVAMFSDGIETLALNYAERAAHQPFFQSLLKPLRASNVAEEETLPSGEIESLSDALAQFLSSERVNERTDDDKTILLASRCEKESVAVETSAAASEMPSSEE